MQIILNTFGGLGNRFGPLFSIYQICKMYNIKLLIHWNNESFVCKNGLIKMSANFDDLFICNDISFINTTTYNNFLNSKNSIKITNGYIDTNLFIKYNTIIFEDWVYMVSTNPDNIKKWKPYTKKMGLYYEDEYIKNIRSCLKDFKLTDTISESINKTLLKFTTNMLGIHIRGSDDSDDSYYRTSNLDSIKYYTKDLIYDKINKHLCDKNNKIFLITPHPKIEQIIIEKYGDKIITFNKDNNSYKDNRSTINGLKNAIVDLILFSKCNKLIGTAGSSFSFVGWLFSNCNNYETLLGQDYL